MRGFVTVCDKTQKPLDFCPKTCNNKSMKNNKRNKPLGAVRTSDTNLGGWSAGTTGAQMTMTPQRGLGASMVPNLDRVVASAKLQYVADRKAAARDRAVEREALAFAALDDLLADL